MFVICYIIINVVVDLDEQQYRQITKQTIYYLLYHYQFSCQLGRKTILHTKRIMYKQLSWYECIFICAKLLAYHLTIFSRYKNIDHASSSFYS